MNTFQLVGYWILDLSVTEVIILPIFFIVCLDISYFVLVSFVSAVDKAVDQIKFCYFLHEVLHVFYSTARVSYDF